MKNIKSFKKNHLNILLIFLFTLNVLNGPKSLLAQTLLFRSKEASEMDFNAFLKTDTPYISFEDFYLKSKLNVLEKSKTSNSSFPFSKIDFSYTFKTPDSQKAFKHLKKMPLCNENGFIKISPCLKEAQKAYLSGDLEKAKKYFQKLSQLALLKDWNLEERKALHYSFLRLAQITKDPKIKREYILKAQNFSPTLFPDPSLFTPKFIKMYKALSSSRKTIPWMPEESVSRFYSIILINGRKHSRPFIQPIEIPKNDFFRISFISNAFSPIVKILNAKTLKNLKVEVSPLVQGTCKKPMIASHLFKMEKLIRKKAFVFFNPYCIKSLAQIKNQNSLQDLSFEEEEKNHQEVLKAQYEKTKKRKITFESKNRLFSFPSHFNPSHQKTSKKKPLFKTHWFWISMSSVVLTSMIAHLSHKNSKKPYIYPKRKNGF